MTRCGGIDRMLFAEALETTTCRRYRRALMQERTRERRVERLLEDAQVSDGQFSWTSSR
jgi:hypothetical protein